MAEFWPHVPTGLSESLEFATDVRRAAKQEMRDGLKDATQRLTLSHIFGEAEAGRARGRFRSNPLGVWQIPVWPDATRFIGTITAGATEIAVETDADYRVGGLACILDTDTRWELVTVAAAADGLLTLTSPISGSYAGVASNPVIVAPVARSVAPGGMVAEDVFALSRMTIQFLTIDPLDLGLNPYPLHRTYPVITDPSAVLTPLAGMVSQESELMDSGFGVYDLSPIEDYVRQASTLGFADWHADTRWARRRWLHHQRGRDLPFWLPSWKNDLALVSPVSSGATTITTQKITPVAADLVGRSIQIDVGGLLIHRQITAASTFDQTHTLTIAAPGVAVPASSPVSLMVLSRFDTDLFEIAHQTTQDGYFTTFSAVTIEVQA